MTNLITTILIVLANIPSLAMAHVVNQPSPQLRAWVKTQMKHYNIPGASIAVIKNYHIVWAQGFGWRDKARQLPVTKETLFQAASISKPFTAVAALETFFSENISIDDDINHHLSRWKIPANPFTKQQPVTLKLLFSHTAGITGFREKGYSVRNQIPTLLQILNGKPPANTPPIIVVRKPNTKFEYSPASYTIVQAALIDINKQSFNTIMKNSILTPLGMSHSTFLQPLPHSYTKNIALPYLPNGQLVPDSPYTFPTAAAGGLWSTPSDIAQFVIAIQKALIGKTTAKITPQLVSQIMIPQLSHNMGMGFEVNVDRYGALSNEKGDYFRHGGFQTGYLSMFVGSKKEGNGIIIMCNSAPYMTVIDVKQYEFLAKTIQHISQLEHWT